MFFLKSLQTRLFCDREFHSKPNLLFETRLRNTIVAGLDGSMHPYWYSIDDIDGSIRVPRQNPLILHDAASRFFCESNCVSPQNGTFDGQTKALCCEKCCIARDLRIFGQPLYLPNQQVRWRFDLEETNVLFFKGISMPKSLSCLFVVPPSGEAIRNQKLCDRLETPPKERKFAKKGHDFRLLRGNSYWTHVIWVFWSHWFSKFPSLISW